MKYNFLALTAFLLVGKSAHGAADADKTNTANNAAVLAPDATADDLKQVDCAKLTAKDLNALKKYETCSALTAKCLSKFDATKVCGACLAQVEASEWQKFEVKTLNEVTNGDVSNMVLTPQQLQLILKKTDLTKLPASFTGFVVINAELLETIFKTQDPTIVATFLTATNLAMVNKETFRRFTAQLVGVLKEDAFSEIDGLRLSLIPARSFVGFTPKQWSKVKPATVSYLTEAQAKQLSDDCYNAMTAAQIRNFGQAVTAAPTFAAATTDDSRTIVTLQRRLFVTEHPCNAISTRSQKFDKGQAKAFEEVCEPVKAFNVNSGSILIPTLATTGFILAAALIPALL